MFEPDNRAYYAKRAAHAAGLGDHAADIHSAALHYELALRYMLLAVRGPPADPAQSNAGERAQDDLPELGGMMFGGSSQPHGERSLQQA